MRGKLTDQDLTNYALNELEPRERLYVESMLAVSTECRNDVYEMVEMAQMLETVFEKEECRVPATLTAHQRAVLLQPRRGLLVPSFVRQTAAALALAACLAFALVHSEFLNRGQAGQMVAASAQAVTDAVGPATQMVSQAVGPMADGGEFAAFVKIRGFAEDSPSWIQSATDALQPPSVVCTPPTWLEGAEMVELR